MMFGYTELTITAFSTADNDRISFQNFFIEYTKCGFIRQIKRDAINSHSQRK